MTLRIQGWIQRTVSLDRVADAANHIERTHGQPWQIHFFPRSGEYVTIVARVDVDVEEKEEVKP